MDEDTNGGDFKLDLDLDTLNLTSEEIDFDEIDDDLERFQEDEMVKAALQRGVDLRKYGQELETQLKEAEEVTVEQYMENRGAVNELHEQLDDCDSILARMQEMLFGFQADLGGISEEIKHLQDESLSMNIRLKNRRAAEELLHKFVEHTAMDPELVQYIMDDGINDGFLEAVIDLNAKLTYLNQDIIPKDGSSLDLLPKNTYAGRMLLPELEKLRGRAITKIRDYFNLQFSALRKPKTNVQMLQQNALVKYAPLYQFLRQEAPLVAEDLRSIYTESMGRTVYSLFKNYYQQLCKLELIYATKLDHVAVDDAALRSMFTQKVTVNKRCDAFALGDRDIILDQVEAPPILVHVATAENQRFPFEAIMRSIVKHLSDAATSEFLFVVDFFKTSPRDTFNRIFGKTLASILENLENYLLNCFDAVGIMLLIKVTHGQRLVMQRRRIPVLDPFFDKFNLLLWPRFQKVFHANITGIRNAQPKKLGNIELTPHYVSKRYAELVSSMLALHGGNDAAAPGVGGEHMLIQNLQLMRGEIIGLMERMAAQLPTPIERKVFFINNIDQMLNVFQERRVMSEEVQKLEDMLMQHRELFAEDELKATFPRLVSFVTQTEQAMAASGNTTGARFAVDEGLVEGLVREFASAWKTGIQQINDDVLNYFANFRNGMEILKQVLTQLLLYYTRFQDIIKKSFARPPAFSKDLVSTNVILQEIKRYSRTF